MADTVPTSSSVSYESLGASEPTVLPTSFFYFWQEWKHAIHMAITFNPVAKAELDAAYVNKKAAEVKALEDKDPQNTEAIARALDNYTKAQNELITRLQSLSSNPNAAELIQKAEARIATHTTLFHELEKKFENNDVIKESAEKAQKTTSIPTNPSSQSESATSRIAEDVTATNPHCIKAKQLGEKLGQVYTNPTLYQETMNQITQESVMCSQAVYNKAISGTALPQSPVKEPSATEQSMPQANTSGSHCEKAAALLKQVNASGSTDDARAYATEYGLCLKEASHQ